MVKSQGICCIYSARSSGFNLVRNHVMVLSLALKRSTSRSLPGSGCARGGEAGKAWLISELGWQGSTNTSQPTAFAFCSGITNQPPQKNDQKSENVFVCFKIMNLCFFWFVLFFSRHLQYFSFHSVVYKSKCFPYWASCNISIWETETLGKQWQGSDIQNLCKLLIPFGFEVCERPKYVWELGAKYEIH